MKSFTNSGTRPAFDGTFTSAGERISLRCGSRRVAHELAGALDGELGPPGDPAATLSVTIDDARIPFSVAGLEFIARGVWRGDRQAVIANVCSSGFDLHLTLDGDHPRFSFRRRPPLGVRAASVLRARHRQLTRTTLLNYPAMWMAARAGRAPLHVGSFRAAGLGVLVGGPSGVGKSTALRLEIATGAQAMSDNLCVTDGTCLWPVSESMRLAGLGGSRAPHGRGEAPLPGRLAEVSPDVIVLLRRGVTGVRTVDAPEAARALVAGTYMAGELRRFWSFAATLASATGTGPAHPPVSALASSLADALPCVEVTRSAPDDAPISTLLRGVGVASRGGPA